MFPEMNYLHENQSDLAMNLSALLMIFFCRIKNKCSMAFNSRGDDCETGPAQDNIEKECEWDPVWDCAWVDISPSCSWDMFFLQISSSQSKLLVYTRGLSSVCSWHLPWKKQSKRKKRKPSSPTHLLLSRAGWKFPFFIYTTIYPVWSC